MIKVKYGVKFHPNEFFTATVVYVKAVCYGGDVTVCIY